jgi:hypothetical protein
MPAGEYLVNGPWVEHRPFASMAGRLLELGVAPMDERAAVVAVGSNASPARLADKCGPAAVIPVGRVTAVAWAAVYSAHISRYGSIAATLWPESASSTSLAITLLDADQLRAIDVTEPNYRRVDLGPLLGGRPVTGYRSWRGALSLDGSPIRLAEIAASSPLPVLSQIEVLDAVARRSGLATSGSELATGVGSGTIAQETVIAWMGDGHALQA